MAPSPSSLHALPPLPSLGTLPPPHTHTRTALIYYPSVILGTSTACDVSSNSSELEDHPGVFLCVTSCLCKLCQCSGDSGTPACTRHTRAAHKGPFVFSPRIYSLLCSFRLFAHGELRGTVRVGCIGLPSVCEERVEPVVCFISLMAACAKITLEVFAIPTIYNLLLR